MAQPVVSYPGAKWRFYPHMVEYFPLDMKVYLEPFFGGGSVGLSVADDPRFSKLERIVVGDLYTDMWAMWTGIKQDPAAVEEIATKWFKEKCPTHEIMRENNVSRVSLVDYIDNPDYLKNPDLSTSEIQEISEKLAIYSRGMAEADAFWKWSQTVDTNSMTIPERAARMILVNKVSFSGMGDSGSLSKDQFCDFKLEKLRTIYDASRILKKVEILNVSFEDTMNEGLKYDANDVFCFLDPPYAKQESSGLYGKGGSTHHGFPHQYFADYTKALPYKWFVTYDDSVIVRKLFAGNTYSGEPCLFRPFKTIYTMAGKTAEDALAGEELFIANYDIDSVNLTGTSDDDDSDFDF
jgi:DNA adenine methylase